MKDTWLALKAKNGNQEALEIIVRKYYQELYAYFIYRGCSPDDSKDLVQETFLKLTRNIVHYVPSAKFKTYLYTISNSVIIDFFRRKKEEVHLEEDHSLWNQQDSYQDINHQIQLILASIPDDDRELLILYYYQKLTYKEISELKDIPVSTIKYHVKQAILHCQQVLKEEEIHEIK